MEISATQVKALRDRTGAGMMECKAALVDTLGDLEQAAEALKSRGLALAKNREERETNEGRIFVQRDGARAALLELRCETDFVSLNDRFIALGQQCVRELLSGKSERIAANIADTIAVIKENIVLGRTALLEASREELMIEYVHGEGSFASIVKMSCPAELQSDVRPIAHELALHIVARGPRYIAAADVPKAVRTEAETRFRDELAEQRKPEALWPKIVEGRWAKYLRERCLLLQPFLKDEDLSVADWLESAGRSLGTPVRVTGFAYAGVKDRRE